MVRAFLWRSVQIGLALCLLLACSESGEERGASPGSGESVSTELPRAAVVDVMPGAYLVGRDFRGLDLSGKDLRACVLDRSDFRGADLSGAKLALASVCDARFEGAKGLEEASLSEMIFERGRAPHVDEGLRGGLRTPKGAVQIPAFDPSSRPWKRMLERVRDAGGKVEIVLSGPRLTPMLTDPASTLLVRVLARVRAAVRVAFADLASDTAHFTVCVATDAPGGFDRVRCSVAGRERILESLPDLADLNADASAKSVELSSWAGFEQIATTISLLAKPRRVAIVAADAKMHSQLRSALKAASYVVEHVEDVKAAKDAHLFFVPDPRGVDYAALWRALKAGSSLVLCAPHEMAEEDAQAARGFLRAQGFERGARRVCSGAKDPMSGETSFGQGADRVLILRDSFSAASAATRAFRERRAIVELASVRKLAVDGGHALMKTPPYAWEGAPGDKPKDPKDLVSFDVAAMKGRVVVIAARCFANRSMHIGNSNGEFARRLADALLTL